MECTSDVFTPHCAVVTRLAVVEQVPMLATYVTFVPCCQWTVRRKGPSVCPLSLLTSSRRRRKLNLLDVAGKINKMFIGDIAPRLL